MWAYFDESGNTGTNAFDESQPFFSTGWMASKTNFDVRAARRMEALATRIGLTHLHANQVPPEQRQPYYSELASIAEDYGVRYAFCRIEKRYLVACKLIDVLFDSVENFGVPPQWYFARPLRMGLVFALAEVVPEELYRAFWKCLFEPNNARRIAQFTDVVRRLRPHCENLTDARIREVVGSALDWAIRHPETITLHLTRRHSYGHAPNIAAFTPAVIMLDQLAKKWRSRSVTLLHDQTSQFGVLLREAHERFESGSLGAGRDLMLPFEGDLHFLRGSQFQVSDSRESPGIQMVDAALWMLTRADRESAIPIEAYPLHRYMTRRTYMDDLSFKTVQAAVSREYEAIMAMPFTADDLARGQAFRDANEERRLRAIRDYESALEDRNV